MPIYNIRLAVLIMLCCLAGNVAAQEATQRAIKVLNVANGLPQSFISGLVQDSTGFVWIATRDGLARYDGKKFKIFRHQPGDSTTLESNTIANLFLDRQGRLWIQYETGAIDVLDTKTEILHHLTKDPVFRPLQSNVWQVSAVAEDGAGNIWLLRNQVGLFICNVDQRICDFYTGLALGLRQNSIIGITSVKGNIALVTNTALVLLDAQRRHRQTVRYTFSKPHIAKPDVGWIETLAPCNGDKIIIHDSGRLLIYNHNTGQFAEQSLQGNEAARDFRITPDCNGAVYMYYDQKVYKLDAADRLSVWKSGAGIPAYGFKSMLVDRSGVLWLGGNTSGLHLYDLRLPRMTGKPYEKSFHEDLLTQYLSVPAEELTRYQFNEVEPYYFRWVQDRTGTLWFAKALAATANEPLVYKYKNGHLSEPQWRYTDTIKSRHTNICALAVSPSGKLWGMDYFLRLVYFDTAAKTLTAYPPVTNDVNLNYNFTVNSLFMDGEDRFWIATALNGLFFYDLKSGKTKHYNSGDTPGALPVNELMNMVNDPADTRMLWIGSLGGGLIHFDKKTGKSRTFTTRDGLPDNTVYAILIDNNGTLWCSSNKGIFSFGPNGKTIRSFTSKDGLPGDEFNRYHFFGLPDGRFAFGGVDGYAVFDPLVISDDAFQPQVALTSISINNTPADFGATGSPFKSAINNLPEISLGYKHNFLTFEFAALEYNIPEKLQYRYKLEGFNEAWIYAGNENRATYTKVPPGHYVLKVNATNTSGQWSSYVKTLTVVIQPPFWKTDWFTVLWIGAVAAAVYFLVHYRIAAVRKEEQQKAQFEREAAELKAQALRAQMNPHFIFNCLNSIKALIQEDNKLQAVRYLTTFSKLIRAQLNNVLPQISLRDELETCKLYTQLEALRFGGKIDCRFTTDETVDLHSVRVPPLILQPFIENAIWHGILPKEGGNVTVSVTGQEGTIQCRIEDDGIGRERAGHNKATTASATHQSKGMSLVQDRLNLHHGGAGRIEVIDKKDSQGCATGTLVIVTFQKET